MLARLRTLFIEKLGGYPDIDSAIEAIRDKGTAEKYKILTLAVKKNFKTLGPEDILHVNSDGDWVCENKTLNDGEKALLIAEANRFVQSKLWKIFQADVKYQACRRMFLAGQTPEDLIGGKLFLFTLDVFKTRLNSMSKGSGSINAK